MSVIKPHCFNDCHHCTGFDNENDDHEDEWLGFPTDCDFVSQRFGSGSFELEKCYFAIDENRNIDCIAVKKLDKDDHWERIHIFYIKKIIEVSNEVFSKY